jgi:hypothetical protein
MKAIGVAVGGISTDVVYSDLASGEMAIYEVSTMLDDTVTGITEICRDDGVELDEIARVLPKSIKGLRGIEWVNVGRGRPENL